MNSIYKTLLAGLLRLINPHKPLGTKLFDAIARVSVSVAFEAVALRRNRQTGETEVFLIQRPENDSAYPGQWHVPGSVLHPSENDEHVLKRLSRREFGVPIIKSKFVAMVSTPGEVRGHFLSLVYRVELDGDPKNGNWFPVNKLPKQTVETHKKYIIPLAARAHKFRDVEDAKVKVLDA